MFVTNQQPLKTMQSDIIYKRTLDRLRREIEAHVCPKSGKASMKAFCEEYGINRPNLATVLGNKSEMSVALFVRICEALGQLVQGRVPHDVKQLDRISLRGYLAVDYTAVTQTLLTLHLVAELRGAGHELPAGLATS
jgi:hypothetical protein